MAWTSAFDVGPCEVVALYVTGGGDEIELLRVTMGKGDTVTCGGDDQPGPYDVAVSGTGQVSIAGDQFGGGGGTLVLRVIPATPPTDACRLRGLEIDTGVYGVVHAYAISDYTDVASSIALGGDVGEWTPDPCDLAADAIEMSIYAEARGI